MIVAFGQQVNAQSDDWGIWTSVEIKKSITKRMRAFVEGEYRTRDGFSETERWAGSIGLDYKIFSFLKASAGYTFIYRQTEDEITKKGNIIPAYWQPRHRLNLSLTGSYEWKRFTFSLRERWQYTYRPEQYVAKFDEDGVTPKDDELVKGKGKNILRSRAEIEYNIRKTPLTPFVSSELYHNFSGFDLEKIRWTAGVTFKVNKNNSLQLYYRYQNNSDDDESNGHVAGVGYTFKF